MMFNAYKTRIYIECHRLFDFDFFFAIALYQCSLIYITYCIRSRSVTYLYTEIPVYEIPEGIIHILALEAFNALHRNFWNNLVSHLFFIYFSYGLI